MFNLSADLAGFFEQNLAQCDEFRFFPYEFGHSTDELLHGACSFAAFDACSLASIAVLLIDRDAIVMPAFRELVSVQGSCIVRQRPGSATATPDIPIKTFLTSAFTSVIG
jgi:hypothetical protein